MKGRKQPHKPAIVCPVCNKKQLKRELPSFRNDDLPKGKCYLTCTNCQYQTTTETEVWNNFTLGIKRLR